PDAGPASAWLPPLPGGQIRRAAGEASGSGWLPPLPGGQIRRAAGRAGAGARQGGDGARGAGGGELARGSAPGKEQQRPELPNLDEPGRACGGRSSRIKQPAAVELGPPSRSLLSVLSPTSATPHVSTCAASVPLTMSSSPMSAPLSRCYGPSPLPKRAPPQRPCARGTRGTCEEVVKFMSKVVTAAAAGELAVEELNLQPVAYEFPGRHRCRHLNQKSAAPPLLVSL
ncbi:unnamed protein product, partial [Urochloa humidicola]